MVQPTPERIIVGIEPYGQMFWQNYVLPLIPYITDTFKEPVLRHIYQEIFRQIFDVISYDLQDFTIELFNLPYFERLTLEPFFMQNEALQDHFKKGVTELGMGVFYACNGAQIWSYDEIYLLDHVTTDCLLLFKAT